MKLPVAGRQGPVVGEGEDPTRVVHRHRCHPVAVAGEKALQAAFDFRAATGVEEGVDEQGGAEQSGVARHGECYRVGKMGNPSVSRNMTRFNAINSRNSSVALFADGAPKGRVPAGRTATFSAPEGEVWEARDQKNDIVAVYEATARVPEWHIPAAPVGLPVSLQTHDAGPYSESLAPRGEIDFLPGTGELRAILLFVDFADVRASNQKWADEDEIVDHVVGDAAKQIREASFGALKLSVQTVPGWRNLTKQAEEYADPACRCISSEMRPLIEEAVGLYPQVDISQYDLVYIVTARSDDFTLSPAWSATDKEVIQTPKGEVRHAVVFGEDSYRKKNRSFLLLHETYHLLGLPDLYDGGAVSGQGYEDHCLSRWDLMADQKGDSNLLAWHRLKLGWLHDSQVVCLYGPGSLQVDLAEWNKPEGIKAVMVPVTGSGDAEKANLAYLVQVSNPESGGDAGGVLVYSVDAAIPTWHRPIQMRGGQDALSAKEIPEGGTYTHLSGIEVEVLNRSTDGGFTVRVKTN